MATFNTKLFQNSVLINLSIRKWNPHRRGDLSQIDTKADKNLLGLHKKLLDEKKCEEYSEIVRTLSRLYEWIRSRSVPSFFRSGFYLIRREALPAIQAEIERVSKTLQTQLIPAFCDVYVQAVKDARSRLGPLFDASNYPGILIDDNGNVNLVSTESIASKFGISYNILQFDLPADLPPEIRQIEEEKIRKTFAEAELKVKETLWSGMNGILTHLIDRLSNNEDGKPKRISKNLFDKLAEFIDTFKARNILDDEALQNIIQKADQIRTMAGLPENLKRDITLRQNIKAKFNEIQATVEKTIKDLPTRKFDFDN